MFLLVGFVLTSVGVWAKPFWGPEDDPRCSFCKEERIAMEQRLKNCRIAGPIFLAIGDFFWMTSTTFIVYTRTPRKDQMLDKL